MRVAIFDGILESHLASSLESALERRGHQVLNTGRFGNGFLFPKDDKIIKRHIEIAYDVLDFKPDLILVFRPASAPKSVLKLLKSTGAKVFAWLCDDPVLWDLSYRELSTDYDALLHCGDADVIELYDEYLGRAGGVNFPFWTGSDFFPYSYGKTGFDSDLVFLGNSQGKIRRKRYHDLSRVPLEVKIHGLSGNDYSFRNGGYLDSDREVIESCARSKFALNFPQYFNDHRGLETWFDGLDKFEFFPFPSRVIQYAAIGLPILSIVPSPEKLRHFPEMLTSPDIESGVQIIQNLINENELENLSRKTYERFVQNFSSSARVLALENLMQDDEWRLLSAEDRSDWFTQFDGRSIHDHSYEFSNEANYDRKKAIAQKSTLEIEQIVEQSIPVCPKNLEDCSGFLLLNESSSTGLLSLESMLRSELNGMGITYTLASNISEQNQVMSKTVSGLIAIVDDSVSDNLVKTIETLPEGITALIFIRANNISSINFSLLKTDYRVKLIVRSADAAQELVKDKWEQERVQVVPWTYDSAFASKIAIRRGSIPADHPPQILGLHRPGVAPLFDWVLSDLALLDDYVSHNSNHLPENQHQFITQIFESTHIVMSAERVGKLNITPDFLGYILLANRTVLYQRTDPRYLPLGAGQYYLTVGTQGELIRKISRLRSTVMPNPWLSNAVDMLPYQLSKVLAKAFSFSSESRPDELLLYSQKIGSKSRAVIEVGNLPQFKIVEAITAQKETQIALRLTISQSADTSLLADTPIKIFLVNSFGQTSAWELEQHSVVVDIPITSAGRDWRIIVESTGETNNYYKVEVDYFLLNSLTKNVVARRDLEV